MKMRLVKNLPGFSIIYIHDPFHCHRCIELGHCSDDFSDEELEVVPQETLASKLIKKDYLFKQSPLKNSIIASRYKLHFQNRFNTEFLFKKPFKLFSSRAERPITKVKVLKKRRDRNIAYQARHLAVIHSKKTERSKPTKKNSPKSGKKRTIDESKNDSSVKKPKQKSDKDRINKPPGKGTLKRKRWFFDKLNNSNANYEDDIFENEKFGHFQDLFEDDTDNIEKYENLQTPVFPFSISPRPESPSPTYKDCYSPTELTESRKGAEEYRFRRGKMKKGLYPTKKDIQRPVPEKKPDVQKTLEAVVKILNETQNMLDKSETDSDEDSYFPDLFNSSSAQTCN